MAHRDENGNYHGVDWMHPEDVKDDRDPDDERKFWKEQPMKYQNFRGKVLHKLFKNNQKYD